MGEVISNNKEKQKQFILNSNMWKVMVNLSWPAIVAMVLYGLNSVLDAIFVGNFVGETALAAVSISYPLSQISTGIGSLIGVGTGSVLSIALGRKDIDTQNKLLGNVNYITIVSTIIYMVLGLIFSNQLIQLMGGRGEVLSLGDSYFKITVLGSFFWIYGLAGNMIIRAEGKMKTAAVIMGIGLIVDIIFKYVFIVVLDLGVSGAALSTNVGMLVYTILSWIYFSKGYATFKTKTFSIFRTKETIKSILELGLSSFIMTVMNLVQGVLVLNAISRYGTIADISFYGVIFRVFTFLLTPIFGLMRALQPVVGINYGAKQYERTIKAYKVFTIASVILIFPFWIISMLNPDLILGLMIPNQEFTSTQEFYFRIYMSILPILSIIFTAMTFFPSIDKGKPASLIGIARQVVFYIPVMIFLPRAIGVAGVYYGTFMIDTVMVLITVFMLRREFNLLRNKEKELSLNT